MHLLASFQRNVVSANMLRARTKMAAARLVSISWVSYGKRPAGSETFDGVASSVHQFYWVIPAGSLSPLYQNRVRRQFGGFPK